MLTIKASNVTVMVKDMEAAIKFYESIGLKLQQRWENHYAQLSAADIIIGLHPAVENIPPSRQVSIGFMIDSLGEAKTLLEKLNVAFRAEEGKSGNYLHFHDPDGTFLYFVQPKWQ
jgi:catechol 2,3-dioxygenase-like lactoylglutathione lyase family enzyme